jgi:hypothetical protein
MAAPIASDACRDVTPSADAYNRFVATSPQGSLYCYSWWLDAVAPKQSRILSVSHGGEIRAAWPLTYQQHEGQTILAMPPLTQTLGILLAPSSAKYAERLSQEHRAIEELIRQLPPAMYVSQHFNDQFTNWLPFHWHQFQQTTRYTYLLSNLQDLDALWDGIRKSARTSIRNASKHGLRVREASDLHEVFRLYALTMNRQGLTLPYTLAQLERIDAACAKHAGRLALVAEDTQGRSHGAVYLVHDPRRTIYLLGGADPDLRQSGAQTVLLWEGIRYASSVSKTFDFEGSMIRGVEAAIRDLGGVQTPYFKIWREPIHERPSVPVSLIRRFTGRALRKVARWVDPD